MSEPQEIGTVDTRHALLPESARPDGRWVTVCNWCECVIVNPQAHAKVCWARRAD